MIERFAVRHIRKIEHTGAYGPLALIPLDCATHGKSPGVRRVVKRAGIDGSPVHEIVARIVSVLIGIKDVRYADLTDG